MSDEPTTEDRLNELERDLRLLRSTVRDMQEEYAREIRTERVTVVDENGVQRVVLSARQRTGSLLVRVDRSDRETSGAELLAAEGRDGEAADTGLCLWEAGEAAGSWRRH